MKAFMDKDFLLSSETSQKLFHEYAENMPIVDYHCHINPQEIAEDRKFENITQVWLGGDHYKWRQMRSNGVDEYYITGGASDREKFQKWAETLEKAIGNPLYHWSHLELQRYFGYTGHLCGETAEEVWNLCNAKLQEDGMSVRNLIRQSNVKLICTTDDPVDSLEWHKKLAEDDSFEVKVLPAWRPDKAMNLEKPEYADYIKILSEVSGIEVKDFASMKEAILNRMDFFDSMGCCVSDHALEYVMYAPASEEEVDARIRELGEKISKEYEGKQIHLICVLKGGVFFMCELAKRITVPVSMDFMCVGSYGDGTKSSGVVRLAKDLDESIENKEVLIVEDIIDSGNTLYYLMDVLRQRKPASLRLCTLLDKPDRRVKDVHVDWTGFEIPDEFVVGYGLDYAQKYRNLPYIGVVEVAE